MPRILGLVRRGRPEKPVEWRGSSYHDLRVFPADARRNAGFQLGLLQRGERPDDWKPMPTIGAGVVEIRIDVGAAYRVVVVAKFQEAVYVIHAFEKKSWKTPQPDIDLARRRYRALIAERERR
ncbi:MAG: type II toxin-antitoxin system RelE/ParE family toxin [Gemmatimonadaceae bacterium]